MASEYSQLSSKFRKRIDRAFEMAISASPGKRMFGDCRTSGRAYKRLKVAGNALSKDNTASEVEAGGFFLDDADEAGVAALEPGEIGDDILLPTAAYIRLTDIPMALQSVDLPPDDEDVLSTFKNAASGWGDTSNVEHGVKLEDWREVCAVLLAARERSSGQVSDKDNAVLTDDGRGFMVTEDEDPEDHLSDEPVSGDGKDEDFHDEAYDEGDEAALDYSDYETSLLAPRKSRRNTRRRAYRASSDGAPQPMTARQKVEARRAFGLFFPDVHVDSDELSKRKITIRDVKRVADLLNEKLKAEEIVEMLGAFSTSADKCVSLNDFERMVMEARLV